MVDVQPGGVDGAAMTGSQMQANLTSAKESRKRAELDAQLLANRIALLKQEEEKAWKKIEETRKRSSEIVDLRQQNEQKFAAKEQFYKAKWESIRAAQAQNQKSRDKAHATRHEVKQGLLEQKVQNAEETKKQRAEILQHKKEREGAERQANADRSRYLKERKEQAKRKMEEDRLAQLDKYREDYEARVAQEELLRSRTEALVANMEKEAKPRKAADEPSHEERAARFFAMNGMKDIGSMLGEQLSASKEKEALQEKQSVKQLLDNSPSTTTKAPESDGLMSLDDIPEDTSYKSKWAGIDALMKKSKPSFLKL